MLMMEPTVPNFKRRFLADPTLTVIGGVVFLISLIVYALTVQRSVPFWDCGEFIACSATLGVPHPPGTPLFVLIGRLFAILPLAADTSLRINLLSAFSGALAAAAAYFVSARLITWWYSDNYPDPALPLGRRLSVYAGSFAGALFFAFGNTNWANSVEAEVYSFSMFIMMVLLWLTLIWADRRDDPASDRYLVAIAFLSFLSIGIHMTVFMVVPPIFLAVILFSKRLRHDWRFWITGIVLALVMGGLMNFLWAITIWMVVTGIMACYRRWGVAGILITLVVLGGSIGWALAAGKVWPVFVCTLVWGLAVVGWSQSARRWGLPFALLLVALLGYSVHLYIPIRAHRNPTINENDPRTWDAFRGFLERKQYGSQSMFQRALTRRGEWANQLGQHRRMGFWGFFDRQYGFRDTYFIPIFILGLLGIVQLLRRRKILGVLFVVLLLVTSIGLIWYMNFADGTRYNASSRDAYLEVRDRDYFFTPAFVLFAMAIGFGGAALIRWLGGGEERGGHGAVVWPVLGALLVAALPFKALKANYFENDRSRNYLPYNYAHNLLMSADPDAIFFTNGDNDTFPVWCLQTVYGIRTDVRIVNLSLLNTHWYIKQMKHDLHVPIDLSDEEIDRLIHYRKQNGGIARVQDQMIDVILSSNRGRQPVNFSMTVTPPNRKFKGQSIENHLTMIGMAYRLVPEEGTGMIDLETISDRLLNVYQYRGVGDSTVYKNETARRTAQNYASAFFAAADTLRRAGRSDDAEDFVRRALELFPAQWEPYVYLAQLYTDAKNEAKLDSLITWTENAPTDRARVMLNIGYSFRRLGLDDRAGEILRRTYETQTEDQQALRALAQFYYETQKYDPMVRLVEDWVARHPDDSEMQGLLKQARQLTAVPAATPDTGQAADTAASP